MSQSSRQRERLIRAAEGYLELNMPGHALRELKQVESPEDCAVEFYRLLGDALRRERSFDDALDAYARALAEDPCNVDVLMGMAWCYKRTDRIDRAIEATEEAHRAAPDEPVLLYNLACYYALLANKAQALSWLGRALRMESSLCRLIPDEPDFDSLRNDDDFQMIVRTVTEADARRI